MNTKSSRKSSVVSRKSLVICLSFFILHCSFFILLQGCGGSGQKGAGGNSDTLRQSCINTISALETKLKTASTPDPYTYNLTITAYTKFSDNFPQDTLAPVCLYKAAQMAMSLNQYQRALTILDNAATKYPTFRRLPDCIFLQAFIYDDKMKDTAKARAKYQEVITKFPQSAYAEQARGAIPLLGLSNEEIIKKFDTKNKGKKP